MTEWMVTVTLGQAATEDQVIGLTERMATSVGTRPDRGTTDLCLSVEADDLASAVSRALTGVARGAAAVGLDASASAVTAETRDAHDRRAEAEARPFLVGVAEVQELLGIRSRQQAVQVTQRPDFPPPAAELRAGRVWFSFDVRRFGQQWSRRKGVKATVTPQVTAGATTERFA